MADDLQHAEQSAKTNRWWTIGLSELVPQGEPVAVFCGTTELVCFRGANGTVRTLLDQCAHRRAPLSLGKIVGEGLIECPYHGWQYNGESGRCMKIPNLSSAERVPGSYRVPVFPTAERDGFIHVWSGGDTDGSDQPPSLACLQLGTDYSASRLFACPEDALVDLLLDAPGIVLDLGPLRIINEHRFGDPVRTDDTIKVVYAVVDGATPPGVLVSEYPYRIEIKLDLASNSAVVTLFSEDGTLAAQAAIGLMPVKKYLSSAALRGSHVDAPGNGPAVSIGLNPVIEAQGARAAVDYVSRLR